ncbi:MAG: hypothetical protein J6B47_02935 [Prevotella sp.]|nr:hypothetical protein [Prevotella sp.]
MKQKLLLAVMTLLLMATGLRAQTTEKTAYVVYDQGTLYFLYVTADQVKDNKITIVDGTDEKEIPLAKDCYWSGNAVLNTGTSVPGWQSKNSSVTSVVIDKSFEDARPQSCYKWCNYSAIKL